MDLTWDLTVIAFLRSSDANVDTTMARFRRELQRLEVRWELILLDDGLNGFASEQRLVHLRSLCRLDPRIRLMTTKPDIGLGSKLRECFELARGTHIVTLEFDAEYQS